MRGVEHRLFGAWDGADACSAAAWAAAAREEIGRFRRAFDHAAAQAVDLDDAMGAVVDHRMSFWDAMLWATARRAGCEVIFSEDMQDGRNLDGVRFVDPFKPENRQLVDLILPPLEA
jgi:predicted nucleic acid-binding protein